MPTNVLMPALSPTMTEGKIARWLKAEGDAVKSGQVLCEIETDKATMEVEAVDEGTLAKILVPGGTEGVKVNAVIAVIAGEGEDVKAAAASGGGAAPKAAAPAPAAAAAAPAAAPVAAPVAAVPSHGARVFASPLAKRLAEQGGLDLAKIAGTGPGGRVVKHDVETALAGGAVLDYELALFDLQPAAMVGWRREFIAAARIDNLLSCYTALAALCHCEAGGNRLVVLNDHEEVGSGSAAGARGTFLRSVLERLSGGGEAHAN
jgi:pyruvate/2-oxoglutarate dehydrogenase complex dihydrolipoamide acyltransferase (E2) component